MAIAVSTPHRSDAFAAGQWLIDSLKRDVPIWKREEWADGTTSQSMTMDANRFGVVRRGAAEVEPWTPNEGGD